MTESSVDMQTGQILAKGVCRFLVDEGLAPVTELSPVRGLRTDVTAVAPNGEIWIVECKSSVADFRSDAKWEGYLEWCDRFFFAAPAGLPDDLLPDDHGLMFADGYGAGIIRGAKKTTFGSGAPEGADTTDRTCCRASAEGAGRSWCYRVDQPVRLLAGLKARRKEWRRTHYGVLLQI